MTRGIRRSRGLGRALWIGLSGGVFALVVLLALAAVVVPKASGATPLTILTSSMEPSLPPGTLIVVKPEPVTRIAVGDVLTYQIRPGRPDVVSHRVVHVTLESDGGRTFTTKGDNNSAADPVVLPAQVRGVLWYSIPLLGYVSTFAAGADGSWFAPVAGFLLLGYAAYLIASGLIVSLRRGGTARNPRHRAEAME